jgi:hypothetical protein
VSTASGKWGDAEPVTGIANAGVFADISSVSCGSVGNCSAGGVYHDSSGDSQAFVVSDRNGIWGESEEVPGTAALNAGGGAFVSSVSCASAGNCSAGGTYVDSSSDARAFVVNEKGGRWGNAEEVPHISALNVQGMAELTTVSCSSAGDCAGGGFYTNATFDTEGFVVTEKSGKWANAEEVPAMGTLNTSGFGGVVSVSCRSTGNCGAAGYFTRSGSPPQTQVFVVNEVGGRWRNAEEVPGTAALNVGGQASMSSLSCATPGNCSAGGYYKDSSGDPQAYVVNETDGKWRKAEEVPGSASLGGNASVSSVSCPSAGRCAAGGSYTNGSGDTQAFVVSS